MKNKKLLLLLSFLFVPTMVYASNGITFSDITNFLESDIFLALVWESISSTYISVIVLNPLANIISKNHNRIVFWILFILRVAILLYFDFYVTPSIALVDFIAVFAFSFVIIPLLTLVTKQKDEDVFERLNAVYSTHDQKKFAPQIRGVELTCPKCDSPILVTNKFCPKCGEPIDSESFVSKESSEAIQDETKVVVLPSNFDYIYSLPEDKMLEQFIYNELDKADINSLAIYMPRDVLRRKKILNFIFSILLFVYVSLIFFHLPLYAYIIGFIILVIIFRARGKYNFIEHIKNEVKSKPNEKISDIVMNIKNNYAKDNTFIYFVVLLIIALFSPFIIFSSPKIIYEKTDGGYAVRFYAVGSGSDSVYIPETYKGEKVVSIKGNTFSNMIFTESIILPDSITEINGQAFKNCFSLKYIKLPNNLEYLGDRAFYKATIREIELPDTLTYLGKEAFFGTKFLGNIKLSENLTEIKEGTFENSTALENITIPDNVGKIGKNAFYGDTNLSRVIISENSKLNEIESSAFKDCTALYYISLPQYTIYNEGSFDGLVDIYRYGSNLNDFNYES